MKNATPLRWLYILSFFPFFAFSQQSTLQYKLQLMPDGESWGVYLNSEIELPGNQNFIFGSAQATVVVPTGVSATDITSVIGNWQAHSIISAPVENPTKAYISFGLVSPVSNINTINFESDQLLFSFSLAGGCPDEFYLVDNQTDPFLPPNSQNINIGNSIIAFGTLSGGLDYLGNYAPAAWDCHDNDGDGVLNAHEDTNGNGIFDAGDASNLDVVDQTTVTEGLKFKLQLMPDGNTWGVYVKPEGIAPSLSTITGAAQVTVVMPLQFEWSNLTSVSGSWSANVNVHGPIENPDRTYTSFGMANEFPHIDFVAGQETLLFTFEKTGDCPDSIYLIGSADPFLAPNSLGSNPSAEMTVFDPEGSYIYSFAGNYDPTAWNCHENIGGGGGGLSGKWKTATSQRLRPIHEQPLLPQYPSITTARDTDAAEVSTKSTAFAAYPNPTSSLVNFSLAPRFAEGQATLALYDLQGKKRLETVVESTSAQLDLSGLPAGVYLVSLAQNGHIAERIKLVKN